MREVYPFADTDKSPCKCSHTWTHATCMRKHVNFVRGEKKTFRAAPPPAGRRYLEQLAALPILSCPTQLERREQ